MSVIHPATVSAGPSAFLSVRAHLIKVDGLPAHPLVVHGAVVLVPLAALAALALLVPRWRSHLRWPVAVLAVVAGVLIWAAYLTGGNFQDSGIRGPLVDEHAHDADILVWVTTGFAVMALVVATGLEGRVGRPRPTGVLVVARGLLAVLAVATLVLVVITGEAGARAVYNCYPQASCRR